MFTWIRKLYTRYQLKKAEKAFIEVNQKLIKEWGIDGYIAALERECVEKIDHGTYDAYKVLVPELHPLIVRVSHDEEPVISFVVRAAP